MKNTKGFIFITVAVFATILFFKYQFQNFASPSQKATTVDAKSEIKKNERNIATLDELELIKKINSAIWNLRSKSDVQDYLQKLRKISEENPTFYIVQTYDALLFPLIRLEGILWRMRKIVNTCQVCHLQFVGLIKNAYYRDYMSGPHLKALMDYIAEPTTKYPQFNNFDEVQNAIQNVIIPDLEFSLEKLKTVAEEIAKGDFFELDGYILSGYDEGNNRPFLSEKNRYKIVTQGNIKLAISVVENALGTLYFFINYSLNELPEFLNELIKDTGINNLFGSTPEVSTPKEFVKVIEDYRNLGKSRFQQKTVQDNLDKSLNYYLSSIETRIKGMKYSKEQADMARNDDYLLTPKYIDFEYEDILETLELRREIFNSSKNNKISLVTIDVSGKQVKVFPKALFTSRSNLQQFLPKGFTSTKRSKVVSKFEAWDYYYGRPNSWKDPTFGGLLPEATNENLYSIIKELKSMKATVPLTWLLPLP